MSIDKFKDKIFIFDLHNTLYDEVLEYGGAMGAALDYLLDEFVNQGISLTKDQLMAEVANAHAHLGSDWDEDVWGSVPSVLRLKNARHHADQAQARRLAVSEQLTKQYAYTDTICVVNELKSYGARIYIATEATANAAACGVRWLGLDGVVDGVYSWPYLKKYEPLEHTPQYNFPSDLVMPDLFIQKPHPYILAQILLDVLKQEGKLPVGVAIEDVYDVNLDNELCISDLQAKLPDDNAQGQGIMRALKMQISPNDTDFGHILSDAQSRCCYVGDSFFKDGFLARNIGLTFVHAAYGKVVDDQDLFDEALSILYGVTGWEPFLLELTQEAAKLPELSAQICPAYVCSDSLREFIECVV